MAIILKNSYLLVCKTTGFTIFKLFIFVKLNNTPLNDPYLQQVISTSTLRNQKNYSLWHHLKD